MKNKSILLVFLMLIICTLSFGQAGSLDTTFSSDGHIITGFDGCAKGTSVAIQADGKIVVAGEYSADCDQSDFALVRYNTNGSPDNTFGLAGKVITDIGNDDVAYDIVIQADGKIIAAGKAEGLFGIYSFALVRYKADGTLDESFGNDGIVIGPFDGTGRSMILQPDGKILVAGRIGSPSSQEDFAVVRYNTDGTLDDSFGTDGVVVTEVRTVFDGANSIVLQPDGKIVVAGTCKLIFNFIAVVRYTTNGTLDNTFGNDGILITSLGNESYGNSVVIQPDEKIVVSGTVSTNNTVARFAVVRCNSDGTLDSGFGEGGKVKTFIGEGGGGTAGRSVVLQSDGKLVVAGTGGEEFALVRYNSDGFLDNTFDSDGIVTTFFSQFNQAYGCAIQQDGKIIVAGWAHCASCDAPGFGVARYLSGSNLGVKSFSSQDHGLIIYPNPIQESALIEYTLTNDENISIELYDLSGRLVQSIVRSERRIKGTHKESLAIDTSIPSGSYILTLSNGYGNSSIRVVK